MHTDFKNIPLYGRYTVRRPGRTHVASADWLKKQWELVDQYRLAIYTVGSGAVFFILSLSAFLLSFPSESAVAEISVVQTPVVGVIEENPSEMLVSSSGLVSLRSAKIVDIEGATLIVSVDWGSTGFTWTVLTDAYKYETRHFGTRFLDSAGERISPSSVHIGDLVTVSGTLDAEAPVPTLRADTVRSLKE